MDTDTLLANCAITERQLEDAGVQAMTLLEIHDDYLKCRSDLADHGSFLVQQLQHLNEAHSLKYRVKDPIHLIRKIVRKSIERPDARIDATNYASAITDLVGVRVLHLYKDDWQPIHDFIRKMWSLKEGEEPIAYIRHGDEIDSALSGCCTVKTHPRGYRSLHYVIEYAPTKATVTAEIQVRTLFEEAWSEIDHQLTYRELTPPPLIAQLVSIFNGLSGYADQLGPYIRALSRSLSKSATDYDAAMKERESLVSALDLEHKAKNKSTREKELLQKTIDHLRQEQVRFAAYAYAPPPIASLYSPELSTPRTPGLVTGSISKLHPISVATLISQAVPQTAPDHPIVEGTGEQNGDANRAKGA
jgi:putative GTP pyrophosphokinase